MRTLYRQARLATFDGVLPWGWIEHGALLVDGGQLAWVGSDGDLPAGLQADAEVALGGALVTPGLLDCHTHLVYGGDRATEFELRLRGATYEQIAQAGGGIRSTLAATRQASDQTLFDSAALTGTLSLVDTARSLGLSPRTLQRRLARLGTSYEEQLDLWRHAQARLHLGGSSVPVASVSRALGYGHPAHFVRAFRRWEGRTPLAFRTAARLDL